MTKLREEEKKPSINIEFSLTASIATISEDLEIDTNNTRARITRRDSNHSGRPEHP